MRENTERKWHPRALAYRLRRLPLGLAVLGLIAAALLYWRMPAIPVAEAADGEGMGDLTWSEREPLPDALWGVLRRVSTHSDLKIAEMLRERFRLAGTFLIFRDAGSNSNSTEGPGARMAIIDDTEGGRQQLVNEGDHLSDYEVVRVHIDRVVLRTRGGLIELRLSSASSLPADTGTTPAGVVDVAEGGGVVESNRFGKKISENRWHIRREALMAYTEEIFEDPERMISLYRSFQPDRQESGVEGFQFSPTGEEDFFSSIGLKDGDTIRMVNSMRMTSQRRAEFFIGEFIRENLNAVVLDVERDGKVEKLIYLIR